MRADRAIHELEALKGEAEPNPLALRGSARKGWEARVKSVIRRSLGAAHPILDDLNKVPYSLSMWSSGTPQSTFDNAFVAGVRQACGLIDAAIYDLQLMVADAAEEPVDMSSFDPDLWARVQGLVVSEDWEKVAREVTTFVEHKVRQWSRQGPDVTGKGVFSNAFADASPLRLGKVKNEWEGWRSLGVGFVAALSNDVRHHVHDRPDARKYAIGVLGLGSLLLTQLNHEHGDILGTDLDAES